MSFAKNTAVTGFTFGMVDTSFVALTGEAANISGYVTIDGGTQTALTGTIAEEGNGQYSIDLTAAEMNGDQIGLLFTHASGVPVNIHIKTTGGSSAIVGESNLSMSLSLLKKEVGFYYLGNDDYSTMSADEQARVDRIINTGCNRFYHPPVLPGERTAHQWSFLRPTTTLTTVASTSDYTLPSDFGGVLGPMYYSSGDSRWHQITETSVAQILQNRMRDHSSITFWPTYFAIRPKTTDGSDGQRFEALLWPTPDKAYTLNYQYHVYMDKLTDANPYPYGGKAHGESILQACLAVAEERMENAHGVQYEAFMERLGASVSHDRAQAPAFLGQDTDNSDGYPFDLLDAHRYFGPTVTYSGNVQS